MLCRSFAGESKKNEICLTLSRKLPEMNEMISTLSSKVLTGKKVFLEGKFAPAEKEHLLKLIDWRQGEVTEELDDRVHYVVTAAVPTATLTKKVASLNAKGAAIELLEDRAFRDQISADAEEIEHMIRTGAREALSRALGADFYLRYGKGVVRPVLSKRKLDGLDLSHFDFSGLIFEQCTFVGAKLDEAIFYHTLACDFSKSVGEKVQFG
jgi:hypothetical protein